MIKDRKSYRILVVEDNLGDFTIVEDFLREQMANPVIVHAINFRKASSIFAAGDVNFDVILLDLTLPDLNGQYLITEILPIVSWCPVIILTGYTNIDFSIDSISKGISDYLIKDDLNANTLYKSIIYAIERKKIISKLKESEKRYNNLFHFSPEPMWVYDLDSLRFLNVNEAAVRNYGYTEGEFLRMTIKNIRPSEDIPILEEKVNFIKKHNSMFSSGVYRHKTKKGDILQVEIQSSSIDFNNKHARLVLARDVTERVQYIKAIENQNNKLHDIAWTQSHIVRAPLARMMGIVELVKELKSVSPEGEELLNHLANSANELDTIIRDIVKKSEQINIPK